MKLARLAIFSFLFAALTAMAGVSTNLLNLVMPDATVLSGINVSQSVASPFGRYVLSQMQVSDPDFLKFVSATGFDPTKDLDEVLAATASTSSTAPHTALILGRGVFQPAMIIAAATADGGTVTNYKGFNIITPPQNNSDSNMALTFLDGSTAAMGDLTSVKGAIDRKLAGATFTGALAQQAITLSASNSAWFATNTPLSDFLNGKQSGNLGGVTQSGLIQAVQQASGGVQFGSTSVVVTGDAVTSSPQNAQSLVDVLKFLVSMIAGNANTPSNVQQIATAAQFSVNGSTAHVSLTLPEQQIEQLFMPQSEHKNLKTHKSAAVVQK